MSASPLRLPRISLSASFGLLAAACGLMPGAKAAETAKAAAAKPNVLLICVDDLRPELGIYGVQRAITPHIDRLGREGMVVNRAYCQQAICSPSRISMLSGLRPDSTGIYGLHERIAEKMPEWRTMPQAFKQSGYETVSIGKVYHHFQGKEADDPKGWSKPPMHGKGDWWGRGYMQESGRAEAMEAFGIKLPPGSTARDLPQTWTATTGQDYKLSAEALESALNSPDPKQTLPRNATATLTGNRVDLLALFPEAGRSVGHHALLTTRISLDTPATMSVGAAADWKMRWFVDGKEVFATPEGNGSTAFKLIDHVFQLQLPSGESRLDVVVESGSEGWMLHAASGAALEEAVAAHKKTYKDNMGYAWEMADVPDDAYPDGKNIQLAEAELKRFKEEQRPFFLAVGIMKPHLPFNAPKRYWDLYDPAAFTLPSKDKPNDISKFTFPNSGELRNYIGMPKGNEPFTDEQTRTLIQGYLATTSYADAMVGRLMQALEDLHLAENTIVILWGDHGWKVGEYGEWCKHTNLELDTRIPLLLKAPGTTKPGARTNALVESIDIFPTLCELAGVEPTPGIDGRSLVPLARDPELEWDKVAYMQYPRGEDVMGYAVRSDNYRLVQWKNRATQEVLAEEFYDHRLEPLEMSNLINAQKHRSALEEHRGYLAQWPAKK